MKLFAIVVFLNIYITIISACSGRPVRRADCANGKDEGHQNYPHCRRRFNGEMWYYDNRARDCLKMKYLGCGGNRNRYCSYTFCWLACRR